MTQSKLKQAVVEIQDDEIEIESVNTLKQDIYNFLNQKLK